jgi:hypothetical protein
MCACSVIMSLLLCSSPGNTGPDRSSLWQARNSVYCWGCLAVLPRESNVTACLDLERLKTVRTQRRQRTDVGVTVAAFGSTWRRWGPRWQGVRPHGQTPSPNVQNTEILLYVLSHRIFVLTQGRLVWELGVTALVDIGGPPSYRVAGGGGYTVISVTVKALSYRLCAHGTGVSHLLGCPNPPPPFGYVWFFWQHAAEIVNANFVFVFSNEFRGNIVCCRSLYQWTSELIICATEIEKEYILLSLSLSFSLVFF